MFQINRPILAAVALDDDSDDVFRQADAFARFYKVDLHICLVLPELYAVRPLFPQLHLEDALNQAELEASVRTAVLRENSAPIDFVGFWGFLTPCFRHEDSAHDGGRTVSRSGHLRAVQSGCRAERQPGQKRNSQSQRTRSEVRSLLRASVDLWRTLT